VHRQQPPYSYRRRAPFFLGESGRCLEIEKGVEYLLLFYLCEGSLSFEIFVVVANCRQSWLKRIDYAEKPHWEHGFSAVGA